MSFVTWQFSLELSGLLIPLSVLSNFKILASGIVCIYSHHMHIKWLIARIIMLLALYIPAWKDE